MFAQLLKTLRVLHDSELADMYGENADVANTGCDGVVDWVEGGMS